MVSPEASGLSRRSTRRVGVLTTHLSRWFYGAALEGIQSTLAPAGYDTVLYGVSDAGDRQHFFDQLPARRKVDGVIVVGMPVSPAEHERLALLGGSPSSPPVARSPTTPSSASTTRPPAGRPWTTC